MTVRIYLILMSIGTLLAWLAMIILSWNFSPREAGLIGRFFFYATVFVAAVGTISIIGFLFRRRVLPQETIVFRHVARTFKVSLALASLLIILLMLAAERLLSWWNAWLIALAWLWFSRSSSSPRRSGGYRYGS